MNSPRILPDPHSSQSIASKLGLETLAAFTRTFMYLDRVNGLLDVLAASTAARLDGSPRRARNSKTMLTILAETLWDTFSAIQELEESSITEKLESWDTWLEIKALVGDLRTQPFYARIRRNIRAGTRADVVHLGLQQILSDQGPLYFSSAEFRTGAASEQPVFGCESTIRGLDWTSRESVEFFAQLQRVHLTLSRNIYQLFIETTKLDEHSYLGNS
jgi:hypothetical protein